jgi:hypothetical protein
MGDAGRPFRPRWAVVKEVSIMCKTCGCQAKKKKAPAKKKKKK